jgi:hypothetical protein
MSHEERYFDEQASTTRLTRDFIVIRLRERVDLDSELHIANMRTQIGGTYRVAWINTRAELGVYSVGLELLEPEGEIWEANSIPEVPETGDAAPVVQLACERCHQKVATPLPEAENTSLGEGFSITRPCETCKATTCWVYTDETTFAAEATPQEETTPGAEATARTDASAPKPAGALNEQRLKGRAPIRLAVKIIRTKYGRPTVDISETVNVSRSGIYFITNQGYEVGETLEVILPYRPDSVDIPVPARVVRHDECPGTHKKCVAIQLISGTTTKP